MPRPAVLVSWVLLWAWLAVVCWLPLASAAQKAEGSPRAVYGHVLNREKQPLSQAIVYLKDMKTLVIRSYITEKDGLFRFTALAGNVDYEVYADYQGGHSDVKTLGAFDEHKLVEITLKIKSVR